MNTCFIIMNSITKNECFGILSWSSYSSNNIPWRIFFLRCFLLLLFSFWDWHETCRSFAAFECYWHWLFIRFGFIDVDVRGWHFPLTFPFTDPYNINCHSTLKSNKPQSNYANWLCSMCWCKFQGAIKKIQRYSISDVKRIEFWL